MAMAPSGGPVHHSTKQARRQQITTGGGQALESFCG